MGKTTLVQEFVKNEYADPLCIDFSRAGNDTLELFRSQREDIDAFPRGRRLKRYGRMFGCGW